MTESPTGQPPDEQPQRGIEAEVAHAARVYDYMLGGTVNFAADRAAAEMAASLVGGMDNVRSEVRSNRAFLGRAVRYLITEAGITQFLDIGTGIPNEDNVHAVARETTPQARIVYVDSDPIVLAHAHTLLAGTAEGATSYIQADLRDPDDILGQAGTTLDLSAPTAVMLVGLLHHIRDDEDPYGLVRHLLDAVPAGSYLVVSHLARDIQPEEMAAAAEQLNQAMDEPFLPRPRAEVAAFFTGLELVEPGVVQVDRWRPDDASPPVREGWENPLYVGIARKP